MAGKDSSFFLDSEIFKMPAPTLDDQARHIHGSQPTFKYFYCLFIALILLQQWTSQGALHSPSMSRVYAIDESLSITEENLKLSMMFSVSLVFRTDESNPPFFFS
jgi:hypothetical protein